MLDIGHALEAVNITQDERSTLGAEAIDKLGQILQKMAQGTDSEIEEINSAISQLQEQLNEKGNCTIITGSYVGNGQYTLTIRFPQGFIPKFYFVSRQSNSSAINSGSWVYGSTSFNSYSTGYASAVQSGNTLKLIDSGTALNILNNNGTSYTYVALG